MKDHFNSLETFLLILKLTAKDVVAKFTITSGLVSQVIKHAIWSHVIAVHLADIHESLLHCKLLTFIELDHVGELSLLFAKFSVLLLFLTELASCFKKSLEVLFVTLGLEKGNLCEQLLFLLLKLSDLLLEITRVHGLSSESLYVHVSGLEFGLQILIDLECLSHFIIHEELIWDR